jgi:hypothetical protein
MTSTCSCEKPIPVVRAARKGAAATQCLRCGRPIAVRLASGSRAA